MVKVVVAKLGSKKRKPKRRAVIKRRRVRDEDGEFATQFWVDRYSPTFNEDLTRVFKLNVARAIQANKFVPASTDRFRKSTRKLADKIIRSGLLDESSKK